MLQPRRTRSVVILRSPRLYLDFFFTGNKCHMLLSEVHFQIGLVTGETAVCLSNSKQKAILKTDDFRETTFSLHVFIETTKISKFSR
jgi:hypothetical protein